jgi:hypothetical protein
MPFTNETGEAVEVTEPLRAMADVPAAFFYGIISLTAGLDGIDGSAGEVGQKVIGEGAVVRGCARDAMNADDDKFGLGLGKPFGERKLIAIEAM